MTSWRRFLMTAAACAVTVKLWYPHVLSTQQPANVNNIEHEVASARKDPTFIFVVDSPVVLDWMEQAAATHNAHLRIALQVFAGMARQVIENGQPALARKILRN